MSEPEIKPKLNPLLANLPEYLKDPKNFKKVEMTIYDSLKGSCSSHNDIAEWAGCAKCQMIFLNKAEVLKKLGFSSVPQYMAWKQIHQEIIKRVPLPKYND